MMSSADLGAGVVDMSIPVSDGAPIQFHLHLHADTDQDCTIDLVATDEGIQIRLRGAQPVDDADQQPDNEDKPQLTGNLMRDLINEISAEMDTPEWEAEHEASLAAAAAEKEAALLAGQSEPPAPQTPIDNFGPPLGKAGDCIKHIPKTRERKRKCPGNVLASLTPTRPTWRISRYAVMLRVRK